MINKFENNQFEQPEQKYKLPEENLVALDENSELRKNKEEVFEELRKRGLEWPVEIQGSGLYDPESGEFSVYYPLGDKFASWAVTIHELGHLRQAERYGKSKVEELEQPYSELERNAWEAGWEKAGEYQPEILEGLQNDFQKAKQEGKLERFSSFYDYFNYIRDLSIRVSKIASELPNDMEEGEYGRKMAKMIKQDPELEEFFSDHNKWRVDEAVDKKKIESFIKEIAEKIGRE
jgi:hypothetical protein